MTRIKVKKIIWDEYNLEHIKKHSVAPSEVEESGRNIIFHRKAREGRYLAVGRSQKRLISMIIKRQKITIYYLITARDASRKERRKVYEKERP